MELWIRSQDKEMLAKTNRLDIDADGKTILINGFETVIGRYKTKKRTLEILDEIMLQMRNTIILSISPLMTAQDQHRLLDMYKKEFNRDFILETSTVEIKPLNSEIVLYELPKE